MPQALIDVLIIFILILANGVFAMSEIALVSARKARLEQRADEGNSSARDALDLASSPNRFLSTVQVGITLVGVFSGALGGATLSRHLAPLIDNIPILRPYSQTIALVLVVLLITYFSLVIGELIPKRLGLNNPEGIAISVARPMKAISKISAPLVTLLSRSTDLGLRILGAKKSNEPSITEEEVRILLEQGKQIGIFEEAEQNIVESVFRLSDRRVDAIMTPRTEIEWLDLDEPLDENIRRVVASPHAIFPLAKGYLDNVQGILLVKDLLVALLQNKEIHLRDLMTPAVFVPESMPAFRVLEEVRKSGLTLAIVIDEYGGVLGMVTLTDILQALVGDIPIEGELYEPLALQRPDGSWLFDGLIRVDELKEILDLPHLPDEERVGYQTLGGLVMSQLGEIPTTGSTFDWSGLRFEVVDMDSHRVDKVLVSPAGDAAADPSTAIDGGSGA